MADIFTRRDDHGSPASGHRRASFRTWQERIRDPSLTALLILEVCVLFLAAPLAVKGLPVARAIGEVLILAVVIVVVVLS